MPRVSKAQAEANHQAIESAASRLFRERGLNAVSVADVMAEAGLTHGGFYAHYPSKDALAASACDAAFAFAKEKWRRRIDAAPSRDAAKVAIADGYLKPAHCDPAVATCPTATLVTDVARAASDHPMRRVYLEGVREQVETLSKLGTTGDRKGDRAAACVQLATMMGALLLARATHGDPLSDEIVSAARAHLTRRPPTKHAPRAKTGGSK
ncbi:MAG TPA: TetR family transcriptional regulator [Vicinamibacterales bacterium]|nr:TetR family transcriptional regulator [Vicinamibacterales bacterium]